MKNKRDETYKDFFIWGTKKGWEIRNLNGQWLRDCKTKRECKERIDTQTV